MSKPFDPADWYWIVAGDDARLYASARQAFVSRDDAAFRAWSIDALPSRIASEAELRDVLASYGLTFADDPPPPAARDLATEVDAIKTELRRTRAAEAVLIEKAIVTKTEIDDKAAEVGEISLDAKK